jgi:MFS family permease
MTTDQAVTSTDADRGAHPRRWAILAVIAVCQLMLTMDSSIVSIALPRAQHDLGISDNDRQWVVTANALAFADCCCSVAGSLTARYVNVSS